MSLRQAATALRTALPRIAAQAATETSAATTTTARTLKTTAAPRAYHYVSERERERVRDEGFLSFSPPLCWLARCRAPP